MKIYSVWELILTVFYFIYNSLIRKLNVCIETHWKHCVFVPVQCNVTVYEIFYWPWRLSLFFFNIISSVFFLILVEVKKDNFIKIHINSKFIMYFYCLWTLCLSSDHTTSVRSWAELMYTQSDWCISISMAESSSEHSKGRSNQHI